MLKKILFFCFFILSLFAQDTAIVKDLYGKVQVKRKNNIITVNKGFILQEGDIVITQDSSGIGIIFEDGSLISLGEKSLFVIKKYVFKPEDKKFDIRMNLKKGKAAFSSGKIGKLSPKSLKFEIPEGIVGIRGTKFLVSVE